MKQVASEWKCLFWVFHKRENPSDPGEHLSVFRHFIRNKCRTSLSQPEKSEKCLSLSHVWSFWPHGLQPTRLLCPWGFSRQEYWSGLPYPSSGDLPNPGIKPGSPALQADSLPSEPLGKEGEDASHSVVSDSLRPHGLWPTRLLCPWNSPGQNTGVGSCSHLQGIFMTQGLNQGLPHCRQILYHLSYQVNLSTLSAHCSPCFRPLWKMHCFASKELILSFLWCKFLGAKDYTNNSDCYHCGCQLLNAYASGTILDALDTFSLTC